MLILLTDKGSVSPPVQHGAEISHALGQTPFTAVSHKIYKLSPQFKVLKFGITPMVDLGEGCGLKFEGGVICQVILITI